MKSHVSMEQHQCLVCGKTFDTGSILLDTRLRDSLEHHTVTGTGLCPEHERLHKDGYIALVACDEAKSKKSANGNIKPEDAYRTGDVAHVRRTVARRIFNTEIPDDAPMMFCDAEVIKKLQAMLEESDERHHPTDEAG